MKGLNREMGEWGDIRGFTQSIVKVVISLGLKSGIL